MIFNSVGSEESADAHGDCGTWNSLVAKGSACITPAVIGIFAQ